MGGQGESDVRPCCGRIAEDAETEAPMDRRRFVLLSSGALLATGLGACASLQTVPVEPRAGRVRLALRNHPQLEGPGGYLRIQPAGEPNHLLVLAQGDGSFAVVSSVCTHQRCTVDVSGRRLACPCHGSEFDRAGEVLRGPAERPLTRYPATLTEDGELVIELEGSPS